MFWIVSILVALSLVHILASRFIHKFKNVPDILVFPAIELLIVNVAIIGTVTASIGVIIGERAKCCS